MNAKPRDCVVVASEKADFIADRIASGLPAPESELRKLARYLREIAAEMDRPRSPRGVFREGRAAEDTGEMVRPGPTEVVTRSP